MLPNAILPRSVTTSNTISPEEATSDSATPQAQAHGAQLAQHTNNDSYEVLSIHRLSRDGEQSVPELNTPGQSLDGIGTTVDSHVQVQHSPVVNLQPPASSELLNSSPNSLRPPTAARDVAVAVAAPRVEGQGGSQQVPPEKSLATDIEIGIHSRVDVDLDPLSQTRLVSPVIGPDGRTHSKEKILEYLKSNSGVLPYSSIKISETALYTNYAVQTRLDLLEKEGETHNRAEYLTCPITLEYFRQPVVGSDGHTYEYTEFRRAFRANQRSPITRERLKPYAYFNVAIAELLGLHRWKEDLAKTQESIRQMQSRSR